MKYHQVQLPGVQGALFEQMLDLKEHLPQFKYIGGGRDNGKEKEEYSAIFYDTTELQLLDNKMFRLSTTPYMPGKGWDADYTRVVTWGRFRQRKTGKLFFAFNTHFDHIGKIAPRQSARLLLQKVQEIAGNIPAIITGDFNAHADDEPVQVIMAPANPLHLINSQEVSRTPHYSPTGTFNGFTNKEADDRSIDYIFLKGKWKVVSHSTLSQSWDGRFASDHFSVLVNISW